MSILHLKQHDMYGNAPTFKSDTKLVPFALLCKANRGASLTENMLTEIAKTGVS